MTTEAALSGGLSVAILILGILKRSGALDKGWELLKEWLKRPPKNGDAVKLDPELRHFEAQQSESPPVSELQLYLDRLDRERARLDAELETVQNFIKKKEKTNEPG